MIHSLFCVCTQSYLSIWLSTLFMNSYFWNCLLKVQIEWLVNAIRWILFYYFIWLYVYKISYLMYTWYSFLIFSAYILLYKIYSIFSLHLSLCSRVCYFALYYFILSFWIHIFFLSFLWQHWKVFFKKLLILINLLIIS